MAEIIEGAFIITKYKGGVELTEIWPDGGSATMSLWSGRSQEQYDAMRKSVLGLLT